MAPRQILTSRAVIGMFYNALEQGDGAWANQIAMTIESNQESENYAWLGMSPAMQEWIGGRQAKDLREFSFRIDNKDWEATLEIDKRDLRRDNTGQLQIRIGELADRTNSHPASLLSKLAINGETSVCYDGQYFFDTDHEEGDSGVQSNIVTIDLKDVPADHKGTTTDPSAGTMSHAITKGIEAMYGFKDDQGEPMNELARAFQVQVPTSYWSAAISAVGLPFIDSGDSNLIPQLRQQMAIDPVANVRLEPWTEQFAIYRTDARTSPYILQEEEEVMIDAVAEGSELEFRERKHWYGVSWAGNVGYGYWQQATLVKFVDTRT